MTRTPIHPGEILGDELELPRIEPKGKANVTQEKARYTSIRRSGPESLRHFKRTYMEALRRQTGNWRGIGDPRACTHGCLSAVPSFPR